MIPDGDYGKPAAGAPAGFSAHRYSDRVIPAEQTWARIAPHLAPNGITRMARLTGLDRLGIPVWNAVMPNARSLAISQGKGITDMDARVSAAMEALERASAASPWLRPVTATAAELSLKGERVMTFPDLVAPHAEDLPPDFVTDWLPAEDLRDGSSLLVPMDAVLLDRTQNRCRYWQSSDGLASGNTRLEARFHGLMERIERDAECLFHFLGAEQRAKRVFDPFHFRDDTLTELLARVTAAGLCAVFFDMTSDIGIPVVLCHLGPADVAERRHVVATDVTGGAGAHTAPLRAALRALTEAAQSRLTFISGTRDDIDPSAYRNPVAGWIRDAFALPKGRLPDWPSAPVTLEVMFDYALARLDIVAACPVVAVSLSDPALPYAVEKILVPGLEHPPGARLRRFGARAIVRAASS